MWFFSAPFQRSLILSHYKLPVYDYKGNLPYDILLENWKHVFLRKSDDLTLIIIFFSKIDATVIKSTLCWSVKSEFWPLKSAWMPGWICGPSAGIPGPSRLARLTEVTSSGFTVSKWRTTKNCTRPLYVNLWPPYACTQLHPHLTCAHLHTGGNTIY